MPDKHGYDTVSIPPPLDMIVTRLLQYHEFNSEYVSTVSIFGFASPPNVADGLSIHASGTTGPLDTGVLEDADRPGPP